MSTAGDKIPRSSAGTLPDFEHSLPMALLKAREAAMTRFRPMLREHGLTEQQWRVIRALAETDGVDASDLAERSFLLSPSLTRILKALESQGIVKRSVDRHDQRRAVVALTRKGRRIFDEVAPDSQRIYAEIERKFGRGNLSRLYKLLDEFSMTLAN